jgi:prolyl-tRNA editing enzyme YbaK/EbsC (Cys-tRNA(Pro) deacylase)
VRCGEDTLQDRGWDLATGEVPHVPTLGDDAVDHLEVAGRVGVLAHPATLATAPGAVGDRPTWEHRDVGRERVLEDAKRRGLDVELVERPQARSLEEAASLAGVEPADLVKTLVVQHGDAFVLVLVPGDRQIAWPRLRSVLGVNRARLPDADVALEVTGYERGTITPLGTTRPLPLVADASILGRRIGLGAGEHGWGAWVDADALVSAFDATVADVTSG